MLPCGTFSRNYGEDNAVIRTRLQWLITITALAFLFTIPLWGSDYIIGFISYTCILIIAVLGLQITTGYCGQVSLGHAGFMAVGAYASALLTIKLGLSFWLALPIAGIIAGLSGFVFGAPALRIKGFYLALATMAAHYLIIFILMRLEITGKTAGLHPPPPEIGNFVFNTNVRMSYVIMSVMVLMTFLAKNLVRTKAGRAFVAVRDNDLAAKVMGINIYYYKLLAFFIGCFFAGIAGSLLGHWWLVITPEMFTIQQSLIFVGMLIIGGMGSISGVFFGVVLFRLLEEAVTLFTPLLSAAIPAIGMDIAAPLASVTFGLVIVLFLIFEPRGLAHRWQILKTAYRFHPFSYV